MSWSSLKTDLETNFLELVNLLKKITFSPYHKTLKDANVLTPVIFNAKKRKKMEKSTVTLHYYHLHWHHNTYNDK